MSAGRATIESNREREIYRMLQMDKRLKEEYMESFRKEEQTETDGVVGSLSRWRGKFLGCRWISGDEERELEKQLEEAYRRCSVKNSLRQMELLQALEERFTLDNIIIEN